MTVVYMHNVSKIKFTKRTKCELSEQMSLEAVFTDGNE